MHPPPPLIPLPWGSCVLDGVATIFFVVVATILRRTTLLPLNFVGMSNKQWNFESWFVVVALTSLSSFHLDNIKVHCFLTLTLFFFLLLIKLPTKPHHPILWKNTSYSRGTIPISEWLVLIAHSWPDQHTWLKLGHWGPPNYFFLGTKTSQLNFSSDWSSRIKLGAVSSHVQIGEAGLQEIQLTQRSRDI